MHGLLIVDVSRTFTCYELMKEAIIKQDTVR